MKFRYTNNKKRLTWMDMFAWILVVAWMGVIFYFSSQIASSSDGLSKGIVMKLIRWITQDTGNLSESEIDVYNNFLRKFAHFSVYFVMGMFCCNAMYHLNIRKVYWIVFSLPLCILFAFSDEFHQAFVPGRGPRIFDVMIDTLGAFTGALLYTLFRKPYN